ESKGGTDSTVRLAKADVVPTQANLRAEYDSIAELEAACEAFCAKVNGRVHRKPARVPAEALVEERVRLHVLPAAPHTLALGQTRMVNTDHTVRYGSVRYSTSPGLVGTEVWARVAGTELVLARHRLSAPGTPRIDLAHYPNHPQGPHSAPPPPVPKARSQEERDFLALGQGAGDWLIAASRSEDGCLGKGYSAPRRNRGDAQALSSQAKSEHIIAVSLACHDFAGPVEHSE